jgi:hypothetical protein
MPPTELEDGTEPITPPVVVKAKDDYVPLTRAQVESLQRERDESRESERYWADRARSGSSGGTAEPAGEPEDDDASEFIDTDAADGIDGDTPEKLVDEFAAKGVAALKSRGFITARDAQKLAADVAIKVARQMIGQQVTRSTSDAQIMAAFPELKDQTSELFKATAKIYQEAVAMDPTAKKTPAALFLAAKAAKAALKPAPKPRTDDEDDDQPERESERRRRSDSQDGRPRGRGAVEEHDDMLGEEARSVIKAMGITEEEFKASRKVTGGAPRRR